MSNRIMLLMILVNSSVRHCAIRGIAQQKLVVFNKTTLSGTNCTYSSAWSPNDCRGCGIQTQFCSVARCRTSTSFIINEQRSAQLHLSHAV